MQNIFGRLHFKYFLKTFLDIQKYCKTHVTFCHSMAQHKRCVLFCPQYWDLPMISNTDLVVSLDDLFDMTFYYTFKKNADSHNLSMNTSSCCLPQSWPPWGPPPSPWPSWSWGCQRGGCQQHVAASLGAGWLDLLLQEGLEGFLWGMEEDWQTGMLLLRSVVYYWRLTTSPVTNPNCHSKRTSHATNIIIVC